MSASPTECESRSKRTSGSASTIGARLWTSHALILKPSSMLGSEHKLFLLKIEEELRVSTLFYETFTSHNINEDIHSVSAEVITAETSSVAVDKNLT